MRNSVSRQHGTTTVEFSIIAVAFFLVLFGIIELGRALFVVNALAESTRRGARVAVVCQLNDPAVAQAAVYDGNPVVHGLTTDHISVVYLDENGTPTGNFEDVRYARVSIVGFQHRLLIPFLSVEFDAPDFATTLPSESLGILAGGAVQTC